MIAHPTPDCYGKMAHSFVPQHLSKQNMALMPRCSQCTRKKKCSKAGGARKKSPITASHHPAGQVEAGQPLTDITHLVMGNNFHRSKPYLHFWRPKEAFKISLCVDIAVIKTKQKIPSRVWLVLLKFIGSLLPDLKP